MVSYTYLFGSIALLLPPLALAENTCTSETGRYAATLNGFADASTYCQGAFPYPKTVIKVTATQFNTNWFTSTQTAATSTVTVTNAPVTVIKTVTKPTTITQTVAPTLAKRGISPRVQSSVLNVVKGKDATLQAAVCDCIRTAASATQTQTSTTVIGNGKTKTITTTATSTE